jgi:hypothetical protein
MLATTETKKPKITVMLHLLSAEAKEDRQRVQYITAVVNFATTEQGGCQGMLDGSMRANF